RSTDGSCHRPVQLSVSRTIVLIASKIQDEPYDCRGIGGESGEGMAEIVSLADAVGAAVHGGDAGAMGGFTHPIPLPAGDEVIRQGRRDLTLIRMTPDVIYDQLIGAGCASKLIFSWGGNPGVGSLHRFRDAVENGWPGPLRLEEHSHAGMANR